MSFELTASVLNIRGISPAEKLILSVIAHHHNSITDQCNPSVETICEGSGYGRTTVIQTIARLKEGGILVKNKKNYKIFAKNAVQNLNQKVQNLNQNKKDENQKSSKSELKKVQNLNQKSSKSEPIIRKNKEENKEIENIKENIFSQENLDAEKAKQEVKEQAEKEAKEKAEAEEKIKAANFDKLWKAYPSSRREAKSKTRRFYDTALKSYSHEQLFAALETQLKVWAKDKTEDRYKKYLHRWLNDDAYVKFIPEKTISSPQGKVINLDIIRTRLAMVDAGYAWRTQWAIESGLDEKQARELIKNSK